MKRYQNPPEAEWNQLTKRPAGREVDDRVVQQVIADVRTRGDEALREYTRKFDGATITRILVSEEEMRSAASQVPEALRSAMQLAARNIRTFHEARLNRDVRLDTLPGVTCWTKTVPLQRVGLYIPGGSAPLFSTVLMLGIPAALAGCPEIIICTPPAPDGTVNPAILFAAQLCGIRSVFRIGGTQAIAAMAYGTESIPAADKILGPGNSFVTRAKQLVNQDGVAIDFPAGPSEVMVIADASADARFVAADLLAQAEHGPDSQVVLVALDESVIAPVEYEVNRQLALLPRRDTARAALDNSFIVTFEDSRQAMRFANAYAPEHLLIQTRNAGELADQVINAGSVFLGHYSPEAAGDYASGTNHALPTAGYARMYGGVSTSSFCKEVTFQQLTKAGLASLGPAVTEMAAAEGLEAHKNAITIRLS